MRRQFREEYQETAQALAERDRKFLKPRPWWVPTFIWVRGLRIFVRIKV